MGRIASQRNERRVYEDQSLCLFHDYTIQLIGGDMTAKQR